VRRKGWLAVVVVVLLLIMGTSLTIQVVLVAGVESVTHSPLAGGGIKPDACDLSSPPPSCGGDA